MRLAMRLLYFALQDLSEPTGAATHVEAVVRELRERGHAVTLLAVGPPGYTPPTPGFVRLPPFRFAGGVLAQARALRRTLRQAEAEIRALLPSTDLVYTRNYFAGRLFSRAASGVPLVFEVNSLPAEERLLRGAMLDHLVAALIRGHFRRTLRFADRVVTVTPELAAHVEETYGVPHHQVTVVPNGVDAKHFRPAPDLRSAQRTQWGLAATEAVIGYVGNCAAWQRFDLLLASVRLVLARVPDLKVVIVGDGPARQDWEQAVARHNLTRVVRFPGAVAHAEAPAALNALDIALQLHQMGPLGAAVGTSSIKVRAALACGVPVVALAIPGVELLTKHNVGRVAEANAHSLADAILSLLGDPEARRAMGVRARALAETQLSWAETARQVEGVCSAALRGRL